jgi:hypothetical protein
MYVPLSSSPFLYLFFFFFLTGKYLLALAAYCMSNGRGVVFSLLLLLLFDFLS